MPSPAQAPQGGAERPPNSKRYAVLLSASYRRERLKGRKYNSWADAGAQQ